MNSIFTRRSVRKFADKPVEPQKLEKLLKAAMQAPSATNQQPWEFLVITEKEKILKLEKFSKYAKMLKEAPAAIVMLQKTTVDYGQFAQQDMGACVENLLLQAVEEGLGTCWLGVSLNDERAEFIERLFDLPETVTPFCVIALGYPAQPDANKFLDRFDESRIHYNNY